MQDWLNGLMAAVTMKGFIPFVSMVNDRRALDKNMITQSVIIAVITGVMAGAVSAYVSLAIIKNTVDTHEKRLTRIESDFYKPNVPAGGPR